MALRLLAHAAAPLLLSPALAAQEQHALDGGVALRWLARHDGPAAAKQLHLAAAAANGRVFATGTDGTTAGEEIATYGYDLATGALLWKSSYSAGDGAPINRGEAAAVDPGGAAVYVTGASSTAGTSSVFDLDFATLKIEAASGALLWAARYDGPAAGLDETCAVAVDSFGARVFVTGRSEGAPDNEDYATVAYDAATGAELWVARYDGPASGDDLAVDLGVSADGARVFVTGSSADGGGNSDLTTIAYTAATGSEEWVVRHGDFGSVAGRGLAVDPLGARVYATGFSNDSPDGNLAYDAATGAILWTSPNSAFDTVDIEVAPDGARVYVLEAVLAGLFGGQDFRTVCRDAATGAILWSMPLDTPTAGASTDKPTALAIDPGGAAVFATGATNVDELGALAPDDVITVAYDALDGTQLWLERHGDDSGQADIASDLVVAGGRAVAVGRSLNPPQANDALTLAYGAADGALVWSALEAGIGDAFEEACDVAVSPDGARVFTAGVFSGAQPAAEALAFDAATGEELWSWRDATGAGLFAGGEAVGVSSDGQRVFVAGSNGFDALAVALDAASGAPLWTLLIDGPLSTGDGANDLVLSADDSVLYLAGFVDGSSGPPVDDESDVATWAIAAATGSILWERTFDGGLLEPDRAHALALSADGANLYVTGEGHSEVPPFLDSRQNFVTLAYDAATGDLSWSAFLEGATSGSGGLRDRARAVAVDPADARVFVTGESLSIGSSHDDAITAAYDAATGAELWRDSYDFGTQERTWALALSDAGGRVHVGGSAGDGTAQEPGDHFLVRTLDATTGAELWTETRPAQDGAAARDLAVHPDGRTLYASGTDGADDFLTLALDAASGATLWSAAYDGPAGGVDELRALALHPASGSLFAAGRSDSVGADAATTAVAYELPTLLAAHETISLLAGGGQSFLLRAGAANAGLPHLLLGTLNGTEPGIPLGGGQVLPLNFDAYLLFTLTEPGSALLPGSFGLLDGQGDASLALVIAPGTNPLVAGLTASHAYAVLSAAGITHLSNTVSAELVP